MSLPTAAELATLEEEVNFAEKAYRQKLANVLAMAKAVLAANVADSGVKPTDKGKG